MSRASTLRDWNSRFWRYFTYTGGREDGSARLREAIALAMMEFKRSSYRAIVASTNAILSTTYLQNHHGYKLDEEGNEVLLVNGEQHDEEAEPRLKIVKELLRTEEEYLALLQDILHRYAEPFRKFTSLSKEDHRILFVGLEPIVSLSALIASKLDDAVESWDPTSTKIGNLFTRNVWDHYKQYADRYIDIERTLNDKYETDDSFVEFIDLLRGNSQSQLEDLLQLPVQRIPEYDKYLNELLNDTDPSHPDYEQLNKAAAKVRSMVKEREDELGHMDNQKRMERVQDKFPYDDLQLRDFDLQRRQLASRRKSAPGAVLLKTLGKSKSSNNILGQSAVGKKDVDFLRQSRHTNNFNRQYLMEGPVEFSRGMQTQDRYLFLFSDLLLIAKQKSSTTFKLKHRIRVCEMWIAHCIDDVTESTRPVDNSFVIGWPTSNVVATFKSIDLKETWLSRLTEQVQEERNKMVPKSLSIQIHHRENDKNCSVEVEPNTEAISVVKSCLEQLTISDNELKEYQLWVKLGNEDSPYPLCGHELPYAIKLNHIREYAKRTEDNLSEVEIQNIVKEMQSNNRKYEFFLKHRKSAKKQSLEDNTTKGKGKRKSPLINLFRKTKDDKKPPGKLFGHPLTNLSTPESLIAKPVKELLTILFREGPYTVGILRKSCNARLCRELRESLDNGEDTLSNETVPTLVVGALIKDYLRNIPNSLLMEELFDDWVAANEIENFEEKNNKLRDTIGKLPPVHLDLLRHLMCVLYYVDKKSDENKMTAYNLSVCIAPSLLWSKNNPDPLATPPGIIQFMIENCPSVFGEETLSLFGEVVEQKLRQDSSTDSDSMHSVLSTHSNFRRDDSSIDSLDREMMLSGDIDSSTHVSKSHHFSPSNLSGDSGLMLSDNQLCDEDGNGNDLTYDRRNYSRTMSQYHQRDIGRPNTEASRSLDSQYFYNPVPPPRKGRRKGSDENQSPNMEYDRKQSRYTTSANFNVPGRYDRRNNSAYNDKFKQQRRSSESLKSVEESSEADSELNMRNYSHPRDIGTLIKSASGAHLFFEEMNSNDMYEFDNLNQIGKRGKLYKQASEGGMPMSPQSKYSLSSSRDSVLSDSSGSFMNRQNSPDPLSSSAETPDNEERGMSQWLSQQAEHVSFSQDDTDRPFSQDDSELMIKREKKVGNKVDYLVSPKASPKLRRRSPIPVSSRHSFPLHFDTSPKGSGSNTSKEAEDIIKSPKLTITYCSQEGLDRSFDSPSKKNVCKPHLDIYNNNTQLAQKQLNLYSTGLQGTSPPPRVVLQGLSQAQKRDNGPIKGNHEIMNQMRRGSGDTVETRDRQPYLMQESSVSSEDDLGDAESEPEWSYTVTTLINVPLDTRLSKPVVAEVKSSHSSSSESLSNKSASLEDTSPSRPNNPPCYEEALQRNFMLKNGLSPDVEDDPETLRQRQVSLRAKQLYEQSMRQYNERDRYSLPLQLSENTLNVVAETDRTFTEEDSSDVSSSEDESVEYNPRKLYEASVQKYMEEQSKDMSVPPLSKSSTNDDISFSLNKGGRQMSRLSPGLHRSQSDVGDRTDPRSSPIKLDSETRTNMDRRPDQPPPYNEPPPYRTDRSPANKDRHQFPTASGYSDLSNRTVTGLNNTPTVSASNQNVNSVPKQNILVSNRTRTLNNAIPQTKTLEQLDLTVQSGHSNVSVPSLKRDGSIDSQIARTQNPTKVAQSERSPDVFRNRASSLERNGSRNTVLPPKSSTHGPVSYRNPNLKNVSKSLNVQNPGENASRTSVDSTVKRRSMGGGKELPWSVKSLSNIFDKNRMNASQSLSESARSSPLTTSSPSVRSDGPPPYTPPPPFQRQSNTSRSSTSSNSSVNSIGTSHVHTKKQWKYGPQARDSFSSTDDSECSCRYSLNCPSKDNSSIEELDNLSFTDITYV